MSRGPSMVIVGPRRLRPDSIAVWLDTGTRHVFKFRQPLTIQGKRTVYRSLPMDALQAKADIHILLVEDNPVDAELVQVKLDAYQPGTYRFTHVNRLADAVRAVTNGDFQAVLVDLNLPDMQGPQTFAALSEAAPQIPYVILTAQANQRQALDLVRMGAQDYLLKDGLGSDLLGRAVHYAMARKEIEKRLEDAAHFDALTGLPNRALFHNRLDRAIARARRKESRVTLLFLDLDRFKMVNDSMGHAAGDELLGQVGQRFKTAVRKSDTVARMGGDEFTVIIEDADKLNTVFHIATKLLHLFDEPFCVNGQDFYVGTSIGIASCRDGVCDPDTLLSQADDAMYQAKACGGNRYWLYSEQPEPIEEDGVEDEGAELAPDSKVIFTDAEDDATLTEVADVMLVDDNPGDRRLITEAFREARMRHRLRVVTDGHKAVACLRRQQVSQLNNIPRLILLDLNMPGFDGFEILQQIRQEPSLDRVAVVMLSTSSDEQDVRRAYALGANAFVAKPASFQRSVQVINTLVRYWMDIVQPVP